MKLSMAVIAVAACSLLAGCSPSMFKDASSGHDSQGCVEDALRRSADPGMTRRASARFEHACNEGDAAACSAFGVVIELAAGGGPWLARAEALYRQACEAGNQRGCVNLGALLEGGANGGQPVLAVAYYRRACDTGDSSGCGALGRMIARGHGGPGDRDRMAALLQGACDDGQAQACFELAELTPARSSDAGLGNYVRACVGGHGVACQKLDASRPHVAQRQSRPSS